MATFSTNQAKQLYVALGAPASGDSYHPTNLGDFKFYAAGDGDFIGKYVGRDGMVRTDIINKNNIISAKAIKASAQEEYLTSAHVIVGSAVAGQQYILRVTLNEFGGMTYEDKGFIFGEYTAAANDVVKNVVAGLAISLAKNATKAAYNQMINVYVTTKDEDDALTIGTDTWKVEASSELATVAAYADGSSNAISAIVIEGADQPWTLGKFYFDKVKFDVSANTIISSGLDTAWATIHKNTSHPSGKIKNTKKIADLEWFCAGERGDVYRGMGYPNNFDFNPLVDSTNAYGYHILDIAYYYAGDAEDVQKSPKELIIVFPGKASNTYTDINTVIGIFNTLSGLSLSTLS